MVEQPNTTTTITTETKSMISEKDFAHAPLLIDLESTTTTTTPITTNIRATVRHLTATYGAKARYSGLGAFMFWAAISTIWRRSTMSLLTDNFGVYLPAAHLITTVIAGLCFANWHMLWTHMMLAVPGTTWKATGMNSRPTFKKLALPSIMNALAWEVTIGMPVVIGWTMGMFTEKNGMIMGPVHGEGEPMDCLEMYKMMVVFLVGLLSFIGIYIPAHVALIRVEASMLPAEVETVVSFDRTFGGRVVAETEGGSGKLGFADAWTSFEKVQRMRLLKVFGKIFLVETMLHVFFGVLIVAQLLIFVGAENLVKLAKHFN